VKTGVKHHTSNKPMEIDRNMFRVVVFRQYITQGFEQHFFLFISLFYFVCGVHLYVFNDLRLFFHNLSSDLTYGANDKTKNKKERPTYLFVPLICPSG